MSETEDKIKTRSITLKLTKKQDQEAAIFKPTYRSTEIGYTLEDPFARSPKTPRSPERPSQPSQQSGPDTGVIKKDTESAAKRSLHEVDQQESEGRSYEKPRTRSQTSQKEERITGNDKTPEIIPNESNNKNSIIGSTSMDVTISASLTNPKTPVVPKFLCPPTFNPSTGQARTFMKTYERTAAANSWDNGLKMGYLGTFLEGAAELWFNRYKDKPENQNKKWDAVQKDFIEEFENTDVKRALEKKLYETVVV